MKHGASAPMPIATRCLTTTPMTVRAASARSSAGLAAAAPPSARVLQYSRAPAQLSLFQRPAAAR